jgi:hypothetical protein
MRKLSEAEQYNYNWLKSVIQKDSKYTQEFKCCAQKNIKKFEAST